MNYELIYNRIISRGKEREISNPIISYKEKHHIIPRCMNGTDDPDNIVELLPEEHYICHQLLVKIYPKNRGLIHAAIMMTMHSENRNNRTNNKLYKWLKTKISRENLYYRTMVELQCKCCGSFFKRQPANVKQMSITGCYCSVSCSNKRRTLKSKKLKKIPLPCTTCNKEFLVHPNEISRINRKFCSRKCSNTFNNKKRSLKV